MGGVVNDNGPIIFREASHVVCLQTKRRGLFAKEGCVRETLSVFPGRLRRTASIQWPTWGQRERVSLQLAARLSLENGDMPAPL